MEASRRTGVPWIRRRSGGGTVYHVRPDLYYDPAQRHDGFVSWCRTSGTRTSRFTSRARPSTGTPLPRSSSARCAPSASTHA